MLLVKVTQFTKIFR